MHRGKFPEQLCPRWHPLCELCLLGELQDVAVAAVQGTLGRRAVSALVLGTHRVNDETCSQVKSFCQLGLACPAAWHK